MLLKDFRQELCAASNMYITKSYYISSLIKLGKLIHFLDQKHLIYNID